ncbi:MAG: hypothetical protein FWC27_09295 [Firmicutes bacterium]|nr:hypothetical protein [Bacillota bacterium]
MAEKKLKDSPLVLIGIPIIVALIGVGGTLLGIFLSKNKTEPVIPTIVETETLETTTTTQPTTIEEAITTNTKVPKAAWVEAYEQILNQGENGYFSRYALLDLNHDGTPELVMHLSVVNERNGIYGFKNGRLIHYGNFAIDSITRYISTDGKKIGTIWGMNLEMQVRSYCEYQLQNDVFVKTDEFTEAKGENDEGVYSELFKRGNGGVLQPISKDEFLELKKAFDQTYTREITLHEYVPGENITIYWIM